MENKKSYSSFIFLENGLTDDQKSDCLKFLADMEFKGYDYENSSYIPFAEVLSKYPNRSRYLLNFNKMDLGISCNVDDHYFICRADSESENLNTFISLITKYCLLLKNFSFSYIDAEGTPPKQIEGTIKSLELKWLFRHNYFGKGFIKRYGQSFFSNFPSVNKYFISDEILKIELCNDVSQSIEREFKTQIEDYLLSNSLKVKFYDYLKNDID